MVFVATSCLTTWTSGQGWLAPPKRATGTSPPNHNLGLQTAQSRSWSCQYILVPKTCFIYLLGAIGIRAAVLDPEGPSYKTRSIYTEPQESLPVYGNPDVPESKCLTPQASMYWSFRKRFITWEILQRCLSSWIFTVAQLHVFTIFWCVREDARRVISRAVIGFHRHPQQQESLWATSSQRHQAGGGSSK